MAASLLLLPGCGGDGGGGPDTDPALQPIVQSWEASRRLHRPGASATATEIAAAEHELGRRLPPRLTALYEYADGGSFLEGNLFVEPLHGLTKLNADPSRPPELLLFGGDGSDSLFGVWLADTPHGAEVPIIEYDPGGSGLAVAGTSLTRFLTTRSAYYLMLYDEEDALDELGVPERLREHSQSLDDRTWEALARWADPELRLDWNNLYEPGITVEELRRVYGRS